MDIDGLTRQPWVLLPGTLCTPRVFDDLLDGLGIASGLRREVRMRHPAVEDYFADLDRAVTSGAVICGFSLGAIVAAYYAHRFSASLLLLFALNPHSDDPARADGRRALEHEVTTRGGARALQDRLPPLNGPHPARARDMILAMADAAAQDIAAQTAQALSRPSTLPALRKTRCPALFLTGTADTLAPLRLAEGAAAATPHGRAVALSGLGHYALVEDPVACRHAVLRECLACT